MGAGGHRSVPCSATCPQGRKEMQCGDTEGGTPHADPSASKQPPLSLIPGLCLCPLWAPGRELTGPLRPGCVSQTDGLLSCLLDRVGHPAPCAASVRGSLGHGWLSWVSPEHEQAIDTGRDIKDRCHPGHTAAWSCFVPMVVGRGQMGCIRRPDDIGGHALGTRILGSGPPSEGAVASRLLRSPPSC